MTGAFDHARIAAICFDIDGTLADTDDAYVHRVARWLRPFAPLLPDRDLQAAARRFVLSAESPVNEMLAILDRLHLDQVLGMGIDFLHRMRGAAAHNSIALIPGAREALERLASRYALGVVTARERSSALDIINSHTLESYFQCVATARTTLRAKPHPAPILWAANQLAIPASKILMVGDTTVDIIAGRSAGAQTAALLCGFGNQDELERAGADIIVEGPLQLADFLLGSP
ncbi:MAG: HAD family hydrolase [Anaerolineales bacterium]|jgi:HAD superfamily hydrolase (TIGR01509 family)